MALPLADLASGPPRIGVTSLGSAARPADEAVTRPPAHNTSRRWWRRTPLILSVAWIVSVVGSSIFASWLPIADPAKVFPVDRLQGVSSAHWFGTDSLGRDTFARAVYGARVSFIVAFGSVAVGMTTGCALGVASGYLRGNVDAVLSWLLDVIMSFPALVLLIVLVAFTGGGTLNITLALGFLSVPLFARLARAHTLTVSSEEFVLAARASGTGRGRVLWREIVPNVVPALTAYAVISLSVAIVVEGSLSYLGLSVEEPTPSWGGLIATGQSFVRDSLAGVVAPSIVLCLTVLSFNVIGEHARRRAETGGA